MSDIRDFFIKSLDEAECGINRMMTKLMDKIKAVDPEVEAQLVAQDIKPQFYSFRSEITNNFCRGAVAQSVECLSKVPVWRSSTDLGSNTGARSIRGLEKVVVKK